MGMLRTIRTVVGAGICAVAHGLMSVGIACVGGVPDEEIVSRKPVAWGDEDDDPPIDVAFEHTDESRAMVEDGMPRRDLGVVSAGTMSPTPSRAHVRR